MNKLIVDEDNVIAISNNVVNLDIRVNELTIDVSGKVLINNVVSDKKEKLKLVINVKANSEVIINRFLLIGSLKEDIVINQDNKSTITFNESVITSLVSTLNIDSNILGSNNNCNVNIKVVTKDSGKITIKAEGNINKNIVDNDLLENIRILMLNDEENVIIPNLLVSSNEAIVNHNATISSIDPEYLFYLNSKGIDSEKASELVYKGFLLNNLQIDESTQKEIENLI